MGHFVNYYGRFKKSNMRIASWTSHELVNERFMKRGASGGASAKNPGSLVVLLLHREMPVYNAFMTCCCLIAPGGGPATEHEPTALQHMFQFARLFLLLVEVQWLDCGHINANLPCFCQRRCVLGDVPPRLHSRPALLHLFRSFLDGSGLKS